MLYVQMGLGKRKPDLPPNVTRAFETILDESQKAARRSRCGRFWTLAAGRPFDQPHDALVAILD